MKYFAELGASLYVYCTDFLINLTNILNLSYYEINFFVFCLLYPILLVGSLALYVLQKRRLKNVQKRIFGKGSHSGIEIHVDDQ